MGWLDDFLTDRPSDRDDEEDTPSLWEEAADHAPAPYAAPGTDITADPLSPLPGNFPVLDPCAASETAEVLLHHLRTQATCRTKDCKLDDPEVLAEGLSEVLVDALGVFQSACAILYAHGESLLAEEIVRQLDYLAMDLLKPYFQRNGLTVSGYEADE